MSIFSKAMFLMAISFSTAATAAVTPAHFAFDKVQSFLVEKAEFEASRLIPMRKSKNYVVEQTVSLGRGKYSTDQFGFSDYAGSSEYLFQWANSETFYRVTCRLSARATVVPFAKQLDPILEEETNAEQLILKRARVSCKVVD